MLTEREGRIGMAAVRAAARLCEQVRAEMVRGAGAGRVDKEDRSPVTVADFGAQALVCHTLAEAFPGDVIVAEEDSGLLREAANGAQLTAVTRFVAEQVAGAEEERVCDWIDRGRGEPAERFWILDPIDGTKGFLREDQYAVALALVEQGQVEWGFLACPALPYEGGKGALFVARRGTGSQAFTLDGDSLDRVTVSEVSSPGMARLVESVESAHTNRGLAAELKAALGISAPSVRMDSQAKYAAVARGEGEIYLRAPNPRTPDYRENIWDHAAGWLVVSEAGGRVTDLYGQPLDWSQGRRLEKNIGVVATNALLHDLVIEALAPLLPAR